MELNVKLDQLAYLPKRAHPTDAGLDLRTPHDVLVMPGVGAVVDTGVHIQLPPGDDGRKLNLHECDFEGCECPHGRDIVWWLGQPEPAGMEAPANG